MESIVNLIRHYRSRPDTEHQQGILRVFITLAFCVYFTIMFTWFYDPAPGEMFIVYMLAFVEVFHGIFTLIATSRNLKPSPPRRVFGMVMDFGFSGVAMIISPFLYAPGYIVLLWVSIGNGIRYGRKYLVIAVLMTLVAFGAVIYFSPFWRSMPTVSGALLITLAVIPFYLWQLMGETTKARDRARQANEAKRRFLAHMSHEFRTPLNGISGMSQLMATCQLDAEPREYLSHIIKSTDWMKTMVKDVLDFSSIEAGKVKLENEQFQLDDIVRHVAFTLMPASVEKGLNLTFHIDDASPHDLVGSPGHLQQILFNLAGNSVKFTDHGYVSIYVSRLRRPGQLVWLNFTIEDTGRGMDKETCSRVYQPFEHAVDGKHVTQSGTGLGTAIAKGLVEANGGTIEFTSKQDQGTTFNVVLPFQRLPVERANADVASSLPTIPLLDEHADPSGHVPNPFVPHRRMHELPLKILVADDQESNLILMDRVLGKAGHHVIGVDSAEPALDLLAADDFDLAIIDYHMPDRTGYEVIQQVRLMEAGHQHRTPIIISTADLTEEAQARIHAAGADGFLPKPVNIATLLEMVSDLAIDKHGQHLAEHVQEPDTQSTDLTTTYLMKIQRVIGNKERFLEYVKIGIGDGEACLEAILRTGNEEDWTAMQDQLHALRGVSSHLGLTEVSAAIDAMRASGKPIWRRNYYVLKDAFDRGKLEIEEICQSS